VDPRQSPVGGDATSASGMSGTVIVGSIDTLRGVSIQAICWHPHWP
jgi:hypothetical protein